MLFTYTLSLVFKQTFFREAAYQKSYLMHNKSMAFLSRWSFPMMTAPLAYFVYSLNVITIDKYYGNLFIESLRGEFLCFGHCVQSLCAVCWALMSQVSGDFSSLYSCTLHTISCTPCCQDIRDYVLAMQYNTSFCYCLIIGGYFPIVPTTSKHNT